MTAVNMETSREYGFINTLGGIFLAFLIWCVIYTLAHAVLYLWDVSRGIDNDWLQGIFRELVTPGVGGYAAIVSVSKYLPKANLGWVTVVFCFPIVTFYIFFSLYLMVFHGSNYEFSWSEQILNWGIAVSTCIGSSIGISSVSS